MTSDKPSAGRLWAARDYILLRRFCPAEDIALATDDYRRSSGASIVLVLTFTQQFVLQRLCFVARDDHPVGASVEALLLDANLRRKPNSPALPLWRAIDNDDVPTVLTELAAESAWEDTRTRSVFMKLLDLGATTPWQVVAPFSPSPSIVANSLILQMGGEVPDHARLVADTIAEMLNGTVHASVHRDRRVTAQVDGVLDEVAKYDDLTIPERVYPRLLEMARDVTQSQAAALFVFDPADGEAGGLRRLCVAANAGYRLRREVLPAPSWQEPAPLAAWSFYSRRPLVLPDAREGLRPSFSTWTLQGQDVDIEMAVPIPAAPGVASTPQMGVLVLCRGPIEDNQPYGNYDLALARNVVLRIALIRASLMMDEAGWAVARAAEAFAMAEPRRASRLTAPWTRTTWTRETPAASLLKNDPRLIEDLKSAMPALTQVVALAGRLTGSNSVALRFLTLRPGYRSTDRVLIRAVAWPGSHLDEDYFELPLDSQSVNGWVALNGESLYLRDTSATQESDARPRVRPVTVPGRATRSELCVPIFVDHRIIGTMNFESQRPNAFILQRWVASGCAAQAAIAVAAVRRRGLQGVISVGADVQASVHDLRKISRSFAAELANVSGPAESVDALSRNARWLRSIVDVLGPTSLEEADPDSATAQTEVDPHVAPRASQEEFLEIQPWLSAGAPRGLEDILDAAARAAHVPIPVKKLRANAKWSDENARRIYLALFEILKNVNAYASKDPAGMPRVFSNLHRLGGRDYVDVEIVHGIDLMSDVDVLKLYRVPIAKPDGTHIGAFVAGAIIRLLGGDVHAKLMTHGDALLTVVSLPH